jgi:hypothetical protein
MEKRKDNLIVLKILELADEAYKASQFPSMPNAKPSTGSFLLGLAVAQLISEGFTFAEVQKIVEEFSTQAIKNSLG